MKKKKILSILVSVSIIAFIILFDLVTKQIAYNKLFNKPSKVVIKHMLEFSYVENSGAAFGILKGQKLLFLFLTFIAVSIFGYLLSFVDLKKKKTYTSAIILLMGGTIGNAIDRISFSYVIDFIRFPFIDKFLGLVKISGFICNIADIYLTFGIILFFVYIIFFHKKKNKDKGVILKDEDKK